MKCRYIVMENRDACVFFHQHDDDIILFFNHKETIVLKGMDASKTYCGMGALLIFF